MASSKKQVNEFVEIREVIKVREIVGAIADGDTIEHTGFTESTDTDTPEIKDVIKRNIAKAMDIISSEKTEENILKFKLVINQIETKHLNSMRDKEENTLLHLAAKNGQTEIVKYLLGKNVNFRIKNSAGFKAEIVARQNGHKETADYIARYKLASVTQQITAIGFLNDKTIRLEMGITKLEEEIEKKQHHSYT